MNGNAEEGRSSSQTTHQLVKGHLSLLPTPRQTTSGTCGDASLRTMVLHPGQYGHRARFTSKGLLAPGVRFNILRDPPDFLTSMTSMTSFSLSSFPLFFPHQLSSQNTYTYTHWLIPFISVSLLDLSLYP
ncbi:uncharacterized protein BKA55DRAFT_261311 [Fusarium redolens]|uniref:Uncharacterized protein n=1 Tax=Fusarium redolens TaxID=48865 RepID=A0A9P9FWP3_FUSRE|nr:uncharacterized protein BKA55DRAFT_261311 [Fusarium redolens]KAH7210724.1 hypothetical protein BKA55DRAFT_261311 [Fusarium redolens]